MDRPLGRLCGRIDGLSQFITVFGIGRLWVVLYLELRAQVAFTLPFGSVGRTNGIELGGIFGQSQLPPLWEIHGRLHVRQELYLVAADEITIHDNSE